MTTQRTYLDYNATAPLRPEVRQMYSDMLGRVGNASSVYQEGREARGIVERARQQVAGLVGAEAENVIFTSGGSEANRTALSPFWKRASGSSQNAPLQHLFVSAIEHPSVLMGGGFGTEQVSILPVKNCGTVDVFAAKTAFDTFRSRHGEAGFLVSVMAANNETGAVQPVKEIAELAHEHGGIVHSDAVQVAGKCPVEIDDLGADLISLSAHKFGGPQGVGALVLASGDMVLERPLISGGGQEKRRRAGTENVAALAAFGVAAEHGFPQESDMNRLSAFQKKLEDGLLAICGETTIFSSDVRRLPNTTCFSVPGFNAETILISLDLKGIAVSAGSACSSGKVGRSHVLDAAGIDTELSRGALRISFGWDSQEADIDRFLDAWAEIYRRHKEKQTAA